jgi:small subunit ribosomal protein S1
LHISELSSEKVTNPADIVNIGDTLEVRVIRIEPEARKIGLSLKKVSDAEGKNTTAQAVGIGSGIQSGGESEKTPGTNLGTTDI